MAVLAIGGSFLGVLAGLAAVLSGWAWTGAFLAYIGVSVGIIIGVPLAGLICAPTRRFLARHSAAALQWRTRE